MGRGDKMTYVISDADLSLVSTLWLLIGLFIGGVIVMIFYEVKYRRGIATQRQFDRGLFK